MSKRLPTFVAHKPWRQPVAISLFAVLLFIAISLLPIGLMVVKSLLTEKGLSLHHYQALYSEIRIFELLLRSSTMALGATLLSLLFGIPLAMLLVKTNFRGRRFCSIAYLVPLFIPPHIHALAWIYLFGEKGILQLRIMGLMGMADPVVKLYSPSGTAVILFLAYFPIFVLTVVTGLSLVDRRLEEAGGLHVAPVTVWRKITLPLITPSILSGAVFVFIFAFFNYGVPSMLRVPSFPVEIFTRFSAFYDEAGATALSAPMIVLAVLLLLFHKKIMQDKSLVTIGGASIANEMAPSAVNRLGQIYVFGFIALAVLLPLFALIAQAGSLKSFQLAWSGSFAEIKTSLLVSMSAASIATVLAYFLASSTEDMSSPWKEFLYILTLLPLAFPAVLLGIGLIYLWNRPETQYVYAGYSILIIAYIGRFIPFAVQIIISNIKQISPSMRETAWVCESSRLRRLLYIDLPLVRRGLVTSWVVIFIFSMGELGSTLLVIPPGAGTVSLKIYTLMHYGAGPLVAALALLLLAVSLLVSSGLLFGARQR